MSAIGHQRAGASQRRGLTLIEMLVATAITLLLVGIVVGIVGVLSRRVSDALARYRSKMADRLRATKQRLQLDLRGVTAIMRPPLRPDQKCWLFEATEGPIGPIIAADAVAVSDLDADGIFHEPTAAPPGHRDYTADPPDQTVGDVDDILDSRRPTPRIRSQDS